jgi:magnesium-transporting ATPase (P-type)
MKKRNLLSNILYVAILVTLVAFLLVQFQVLGMSEETRTIVSTVLLVIAVLSVAMVEIVFPVLDNKALLKEKKYAIMVSVKSVLFVASLVFLFLYQPFGKITSAGIAIAGFVVLYFAQFFISLDPKPVLEEDDEDEEDEDDYESAEFAEEEAENAEADAEETIAE